MCGSSELESIIDLGLHPFADTFIEKSRVSEPEAVYPLICDLCSVCGQIQTKCSTDPIDRYSGHNYSYTSSNSTFSRNHWDQYCIDVSKIVPLGKRSLVVEIGSNDGFLAAKFLTRGHRVVGVDASPYMVDLAKERNIHTILGLFNSIISEEIVSEYGHAELIVANNVYNHVDSPLSFTRSVAKLLAPNGTFVFESPYWCIAIRDGKFDQIYHEHVSYFTVRSIARMLEVAGLSIESIQFVEYHGGSLRIFAKHSSELSNHCTDVIRIISQEIESNTFDIDTYKIFMEKTLNRRNQFLNEIYRIKSSNSSIIGVGAAAKGNTFLNFYNLDNSVIDFITDISDHKQNKYTPLSRIPIVGDKVFAKYDEVYALILSWNISDILKGKLLEINPNIKYLVP